jgi:hypothetical protein
MWVFAPSWCYAALAHSTHAQSICLICVFIALRHSILQHRPMRGYRKRDTTTHMSKVRISDTFREIRHILSLFLKIQHISTFVQRIRHTSESPAHSSRVNSLALSWHCDNLALLSTITIDRYWRKLLVSFCSLVRFSVVYLDYHRRFGEPAAHSTIRRQRAVSLTTGSARFLAPHTTPRPALGAQLNCSDCATQLYSLVRCTSHLFILLVFTCTNSYGLFCPVSCFFVPI